MAAADLSAERNDIQGLVASGYGHLPHAVYLLFAIDQREAAAHWLWRLADSVTTARRRVNRRAVGVALSSAGLAAVGLPADVRDAFALEFTEGMTDDAHRRRILGDVGPSAPERWLWGGPDTRTVDLLLMLFGESEAELQALIEEHLEDAEGATLVQQLPASTEAFDHFGFRDGISQPLVAGLRSGPPAQTVQTGEFVLGYRNEYRQYTDRPLIDPSEDPTGLLPGDAAGSGLRDLARNGSYLVFRQLSQDVPAFWQWVDRNADGAGNGEREADPAAREQARIALASKLVGRWPGGAPLTLSPHYDDPRLAKAVDFGYFDHDRDGLRCPIGAHVRRGHRAPAHRHLLRSTSITGSCGAAARTASGSTRQRRWMPRSAPATSAACTSSACVRASSASLSSSSARGSTAPSSTACMPIPTRSWPAHRARSPCRRHRSASAISSCLRSSRREAGVTSSFRASVRCATLPRSADLHT